MVELNSVSSRMIWWSATLGTHPSVVAAVSLSGFRIWGRRIVCIPLRELVSIMSLMLRYALRMASAWALTRASHVRRVSLGWWPG